MKIFIFILLILLVAVFLFNPFPVRATGLSVDIVDGSYAPVTSPAVAMDSVQFSFACKTASGTLGTGTEQIYVNNDDGADNGWDVSLAAASVDDVWTTGGETPHTFKYNDPAGSGCTSGQMTVNASAGSLAIGQCGGCTTTGVTLGASKTFDSTAEPAVNSITILSADDAAEPSGDWRLQGVSISQKIPAEKPVGSYSINMVLTIIARE